MPDHVERSEREARGDTRYADVVTRAREPKWRVVNLRFFVDEDERQ
jgi:hypothetical protein